MRYSCEKKGERKGRSKAKEKAGSKGKGINELKCS